MHELIVDHFDHEECIRMAHYQIGNTFKQFIHLIQSIIHGMT